jgi:hypothetical protein
LHRRRAFASSLRPRSVACSGCLTEQPSQLDWASDLKAHLGVSRECITVGVLVPGFAAMLSLCVVAGDEPRALRFRRRPLDLDAQGGVSENVRERLSCRSREEERMLHRTKTSALVDGRNRRDTGSANELETLS